MSLSLVEACKYGIADCLKKASEKFTAFDTTSGANELDRDQKLSGYCYGIQEGTTSQWDALWELYEKEQNANEQSTLRYGLACSKDEETLKKYMEYGKDKVRVQDKHSLFNYVSGSDYGDVSWQFIQDNWDWFYDMCNISYGSISVTKMSYHMDHMIHMNHMIWFISYGQYQGRIP